MIKNFLCEKCSKYEVCKIADLLAKFHEDSKRPLGLNITIDRCLNYELDEGGDTPD